MNVIKSLNPKNKLLTRACESFKYCLYLFQHERKKIFDQTFIFINRKGMLQKKLYWCKRAMLVTTAMFLFSSCYSYRISTNAQAGNEASTTTANAYFWGLVQSPKNGITTPNCDSLNVNGMADVEVKTNLGYALITVVTLGIWSPMKVSWKCSKPCQKTGSL